MIIHAYILKRDMTFEFNDCKANLINNPNLGFSLQSVGAGGSYLSSHRGSAVSWRGNPPAPHDKSIVGNSALRVLIHVVMFACVH